MPIYLVDMSLRSAGQDYAPLWDAMAAAAAQRLMDTNWLIDVAQDATAVTRALLSHMAVGDQLFVLEFRPDLNWTGTGLDGETKAWLAARLPGITTGPEAPPPGEARVERPPSKKGGAKQAEARGKKRKKKSR